MSKQDRAFMLRQGLMGRRILRILLTKPRLPLGAGYFFKVLDASDNDIVWCLRLLDTSGFVEIKPYCVHVATIRKRQRQTQGNLEKIMQLLVEYSPRGSVSIGRTLNMSNADVVSKLHELETLGLVSVKPTPVEFVSLKGGRLHILKTGLKCMLRGIKGR